MSHYLFQAQQRLSDSWRLAIGSTGIAVVNTFFESNNELTTDKERKAFAKEGLKDLKFLYSNMDSEDLTVWTVFSHPHIVH